MEDEWKYILHSHDCHISHEGDVEQDGRPVEPYRDGDGVRIVELLWDTDEYDDETHQWVRKPQEFSVWSLMAHTWFSGWPAGGEPYYLDGDASNCSASNLRAIIPDRRESGGRVIEVREERWGYTFDKRRRGKVEVIELNAIFPGPADAAKAVGGSKSGVSLALSGRLETHCGYHFRWA